jgi:molybdopterin/thiamine biosynthesis adenylyltransferase/rhodanese-related sulfurtransferase
MQCGLMRRLLDPVMTSLSAEERRRYARHLILPEIGPEGQERLRRGSVLLVGLGGLGSPAALYLTAAGVGRIGLVDFDVVDETNLQRQVLYGTGDVGRPKLAAATARLRDLNPHVEIVHHETRLTSDNAMEILEGYDVIVDGTDNFPTRYLVNDACVFLGKPNVYGSIFRFEGQVSVFDSRIGPCYRCLYPDPPPPDLVPSCAEGGVLGVLPGVVGTLQAVEAIKLLVGIGTPLVGRLLLFDALGASFRQVKLKKNHRCVVCGESPSVTTLIDYEGFCRSTARGDDDQLELTPAEVVERIGRRGVRLIDVREPYEWEAGHIEGAELIPMRELPSRLAELKHDEEIILYCRTGARSGRALQFMRGAGFTQVRHMEGGAKAWAAAVDPSLAVY